MYTEQLAILLFVAAHGLSGNTASGHFAEQAARLPRGGAEQTRMILRKDPLFVGFRNLNTRRTPAPRNGDHAGLFAIND